MSFQRQIEALNSQRAAIDSLRSRLSQEITSTRALRDSVVSFSESAIRIPITSVGAGARFGEAITDESRLFASQREPVGYRIVSAVARDIWDNWFEVKDVKEEKGDQKLDEKVQAALEPLDAKIVLTKATKFERRYGWSIIVLAYEDGGKPLEEPLPSNRSELSIPQIEAYPKTKITINKGDKIDENAVKEGEPKELIGWPRFYMVDMGTGVKTKVHHSRVIHDAPRLDEETEKWEGVSVIDPIYDDIVCFRNIRWGMAQTMFRVGSGFPVITLTGSSATQIDAYYASGRFANLSARTYLLKTDEEEFEFKGAQAAALNPQPYYEPILENLSMGSNIPKAILRGAQAGTIAGSEVNQKEYGGYISGEQSQIEPVPRELIDRLIETGQIETSAEDYELEWVSPFEISERDKAQIEQTKANTNVQELKYKTVNEVRDKDKLGKIDGGNVILPLEELKWKGLGGGLGMFNLSQGLESWKNYLKKKGSDVAMAAPKFEAVKLYDEIKKIMDAVGRGDLDRDGALDEGRSVIDRFVDQSIKISLDRLQEATGKTVAEESPEAKSLRSEQTDYYLEFFTRILNDVLKQR